MGVNYLTLGEFRRLTSPLPDSTPVIAATPDGGWWLNLDLEQRDVDEVTERQGDALVLTTRDDFDTRQW